MESKYLAITYKKIVTLQRRCVTPNTPKGITFLKKAGLEYHALNFVED